MDLVGSLAVAARALQQSWPSLTDQDWEVIVTEAAEQRDLGPLSLVRLALLRLTEVEVHGEDLGLGPSEWSSLFVDVALALRLDWLSVRRTNHRSAEENLWGS